MFDSVTLPFQASELLTSAMGFIGLLGPFVLLGIAIALTPRIIAVIRGAVGRGGKNA